MGQPCQGLLPAVARLTVPGSTSAHSLPSPAFRPSFRPPSAVGAHLVQRHAAGHRVARWDGSSGGFSFGMNPGRPWMQPSWAAPRYPPAPPLPPDSRPVPSTQSSHSGNLSRAILAQQEGLSWLPQLTTGSRATHGLQGHRAGVLPVKSIVNAPPFVPGCREVGAAIGLEGACQVLPALLWILQSPGRQRRVCRGLGSLMKSKK